MPFEDSLDPILSFKSKMLDDIIFNASDNGSTDIEEFIAYATDALVEAEEIEEFTYVPYEGIGKQNKKVQIDGYSYDDLNDCLCLFIALPLSYEEDEVLTATEANRTISRATAFLDNAEFTIDHAEESAPGYGLAIDIVEKYRDVSKFKVYLLTDRRLSKNIVEIEEQYARGKSVEIHIWDIVRLYQLDQSSSGREEVVIDFSDFGVMGIPCMSASSTEDYQAYLCNMPGIILAELYNKYGGRLLEGNVRSFLQVKGKVNKGIRATILTEPDMFFAYNNGIAATAYSIDVTEKNGIKYISRIRSLQIVNGGQTTASLATALIKDKRDHAEENIKKIYVPMKLSIVTPEKANSLIANIARFANSQNKVSDADLWSNHPFHIRMEEFSRRILAPATGGRQYGTYWYYERANGQYKQETYKSTPKEKEKFEQHHPKTQMFTKTDLAKYIHVFQQHPDIASAGGQKAFAEFSKWVSKEWEKNNLVFNDDFYRKVIAMAILFRKSDQIVRKQPWYRSYKANIVEYAIAKILYTISKDYPKKSIAFKNIWQKQDLSKAWISQIMDATYVMYQFLIRDDRLIENVTEWAKRDACWTRAKNLDYVLLPEFVAELQDKESQAEEERNAKINQKIANSLTPLTNVVNYGADGWNRLLEWNSSHRILSPSERNQIQLAANMDGGLITSEKKCEKVLNLLEKCRLEGYPG